jgi:hypothetical protein
MSLKSASITAENTFTDGVKSIGGYDGERDIAVSISGTFVATVYIQRSLDGGVTYNDLETFYSSPTEVNVIATRDAYYRAGVKTGGYTSGTVEVKVLA